MDPQRISAGEGGPSPTSAKWSSSKASFDDGFHGDSPQRIHQEMTGGISHDFTNGGMKNSWDMLGCVFYVFFSCYQLIYIYILYYLTPWPI